MAEKFIPARNRPLSSSMTVNELNIACIAIGTKSEPLHS